MNSRIVAISFQEKVEKKISDYLSRQGWGVTDVAEADLQKGKPLPPADIILLYGGKEEFDDVSGVLKKLKTRDGGVPVICLTRVTKVDQAVDLMKAGSFDHFQIPPDPEKLKLSITHALKTAELTKRVLLLETQVGWQGKLDNIIGISPSMREIFQMIQTVAKSNATVLILGESGTGKELDARAIHNHSERSKNKFIDINCGAIPRELLENELFGHERGAFTGADRQYVGSCERANGGTLFLDEVSEMDPSLQVKLLRVLQERSIMRIGGNEPIGIDIRIIAATNRDLRAEVEKGDFREDLYYRLNVVPISIPPLRDRREDIPPLAQVFLEKFSKENGRRFKGFTIEAMESLINYDWPGNVRELENNVERVVVLNDDVRVQQSHLPRFIVSAEKKVGSQTSDWDRGYDKILPLHLMERYAIETAISRCRGDVVQAAKKLSIGQATLYRKIKKYGIKIE